MHERSRKRICRIAFFVFCLGPMAFTAAWAAYQNRPAAPAAAAERLARRIGCDVLFADLALPRPGVSETSQLTLRRPGAREPAATLADVRWQQASEQLAVRVDRIEFAAQQLPLLLTVARRWLHEPWPLQLQANTLVATSVGSDGRRVDRLRQLRLRSQPTESGGVQLQAVVAGSHASSLLKVIATRLATGQVTIELDARETPVPLSWASINTPLAELTPEGSFTGMVRWEITDGKTRGALRGQVTDFDLADLLPKGGPHHAEGLARLTVETLEFAEGKVVRLVGQLEASDGRLSRSIVVAARRCLYCGAPGEFAATDSERFDALAIGFELDGHGLTLRGLIPPTATATAGPSVVLRRGTQAVLLAPRKGYEQLPPVFLAQFLAGVDERWQWHWVPAAQYAARLFTLLPSQLQTPADATESTSPESQ